MNKHFFLLVVFTAFLFVVNASARINPYTQMAQELSEASNLLKKSKVAIIPFNYMDKRKSTGGMIVAERLTTRIVKIGKLQVVERQLLEKVLQELHFEMTDIVDAKATKQVGKVLGVDAIISGSLMDIKSGWVEINARVIKTETAEIITSSFVQVKKIWSDSSVTQSEAVSSPHQTTVTQTTQTTQTTQPRYQKPAVRQPQYQQPKKTHRKMADWDVEPFADILFGSYNGTVDVSFQNYSYPIDEVDLDLDIDGDGYLNHNTSYRKISFSGMQMENSSMPLGVRIGFFSKPANNNLSLGFDFEMSYISQYLKRQNTSITLNSSTTYGFGFWVNDYLKINTFTLLSGDILVQFYNETFRPYIGLGLGMTLNTISSSYIYQYHNGVFRKPLNETSVGFLYRIPIGVKIKINESSSLMGEYRISYNSFSFTRGIKNEVDGITMSFSQFFFGFGFSF